MSTYNSQQMKLKTNGSSTKNPAINTLLHHVTEKYITGHYIDYKLNLRILIIIINNITQFKDFDSHRLVCKISLYANLLVVVVLH